MADQQPQIFDLTRPAYSVWKFGDDEIKVNLIKRKDREKFAEMQKSFKAKEAVGEEADFLDLMLPFVFEEHQARFKEIADDLLGSQIRELGHIFWEMNGISTADMEKAIEAELAKNEPAK